MPTQGPGAAPAGGAGLTPAAMTGRERMLAALRRQPVDRTPVWFMRQAGRSLAAYRELRERYDILTITRTPELCARVTLMPVDELGVDAAVLYADIMLPLVGMGVPFSIDPGLGPIIHEPLRSAADIARLMVVESAEEATPDLFAAIRGIRQQLGERAAVIGFAGAPFTVASYLIEGHPSRDYAHSKALMHGDPELWDRLMEKLTEVTIRYLRAQVTAGVDTLQLFDSWVGALSRRDYEARVLPHVRRIFAGVAATGVPRIYFGTGCAHLLEAMATAGGDALSVDWRSPSTPRAPRRRSARYHRRWSRSLAAIGRRSKPSPGFTGGRSAWRRRSHGCKNASPNSRRTRAAARASWLPKSARTATTAVRR